MLSRHSDEVSNSKSPIGKLTVDVSTHALILSIGTMLEKCRWTISRSESVSAGTRCR